MHTFELICQLPDYAYQYLHDHLPSLSKASQYVERTNFYTKKGITQIELRTYSYKNANLLYHEYFLILRCNLSIIMKGSKTLLLDIKKFTSDQLLAGIQKRICEINELRTIRIDKLPTSMKFKANRVDLAEDILTDFPQAVVWCCNMRFPYRHYNMKRKEIPKVPSVLYCESCCFYSASRAVNIYSKKAAMDNTGQIIATEEEERVKRTVRVEIQINKKGIRNLKLPTKRSIQPFLEYDFIHKYLLKQAKAIFSIEKFVSQKRAIEIIRKSQYSLYQQELLISIIHAIHRYKGLYELEQAIDHKDPYVPKQYGNNLRSFRYHLAKFKKLGIQPVVLPDDWGIEEIPCIYKLLQEKENQNEQ